MPGVRSPEAAERRKAGQVLLRLTPEAKAQLRALAAEDGDTVSDLVASLVAREHNRRAKVTKKPT